MWYLFPKHWSITKIVRCILCHLKIHINCNKTDKKTYDKLKKDKEVSMICIQCNKEIFPFFSTESHNSDSCNKQLLASDTIRLYFKGKDEFNNNQNLENNEDDFDLTPIIDCKYVDINSSNLAKVIRRISQFSILTLSPYLSIRKNLKTFLLKLMSLEFQKLN